MTDYLFGHFDKVWPLIVQHLTLSGVSLGIALAISLPLGLALSRLPAVATPVLTVLGIIYTIPSFALFAFLVPFTNIGAATAIIALVAYSLVVLVRNTMVAFAGVDPAVKEAARGMGMNGAQMLWRVEVPLALPVIVAGMRIATLSTLGLTTIAAWIGAGGLGRLLQDGALNPPKLYAGIICVGVMAVAADLLFRLIDRGVAVPGAQSRARAITDLAQPKEA